MNDDVRVPVAIIGSGNIGTDLMIKVMRLSTQLEMAASVGIDPQSDGLQRAAKLGVPVTAAYLIVAVLAVPPLMELGVVLVAAHMIVYWFSQDSNITPPVCLGAFVAAGRLDDQSANLDLGRNKRLTAVWTVQNQARRFHLAWSVQVVSCHGRHGFLFVQIGVATCGTGPAQHQSDRRDSWQR